MKYVLDRKFKHLSFVHRALFSWNLVFLLVCAGAWGVDRADAAPSQRFTTETRGDFVIFGNTLAQECASGTPAPIVGTLGACGTNTADSAPDVYWKADSPAAGQAEANTGVPLAQARTTAVLNLPAGATVLHAELYWAANATGTSSATFERPGTFSKTLTPDDTIIASGRSQSRADVTADVQQFGAGPYRVGFSPAPALLNVNNANLFAAWYVIVIYRLDTLPPRNIVLFDGLDMVDSMTPLSVTLTGFRVPAGSSGGRLGVVGFDGDNGSTGDSLTVNGTAMTDALNPADNFFNSTRTKLGVAESNIGDLPQLTGTPQSMGGIDIDIVDISSQLTTGDTSITVGATTTSDVFFFGAFVTAIETVRPDFQSFQKTVKNLTTTDGTFHPADVLEYTLTATNSGIDGAVATVLTDVLPADLSFVSGSLEVVSGDNVGVKTDAADTDQAEFDSPTRTIRFRLGMGADGSQGGTIAAGAPATVVRFRARIAGSANGPLSNQATLACQGAYAVSAGNTLVSTFPSGDGTTPGTPTVVTVTPGPPPSTDVVLNFTGQLINGNTEVSYTALATNNGPSPTATLVMTYALVANTQVKDIVSGLGWSCSQNATLLTCTFSQPLTASQSTPSVTFTVTPQAKQTSIPFQAQLQANNAGGNPIPDPVPGDNTVAGTTSGLIPIGQADVALSFTGQLINGNTEVSYTALVANNGPDATPGLALTYQIAANILVKDINAGNGWGCSQTPSLLTCNYSPALASGQSTPAVTFTVTPQAKQTSLSYSAQVQVVGTPGSPVTDPISSNNTVSGSTSGLIPLSSADVALNFASQLVNNSTEVRYTADVQNNGPDAAPGLTLSYQIDMNTQVKDITAGTGWSCSQTLVLLTCTYGQLLASASAPAVAFTVAPLAGQTALSHSAQVQVTAGAGQPTGDPNAANNLATGTTTGLIPVSVPGDPTPDVALNFEGQLVNSDTQAQYTATVTNNGPGPAADLRFRALFGTDVTISELNAGPGWSCKQTGSALSCSYSQLQPQSSAPPITFLLHANSEQKSIPFEAQVQAVDSQGQPLPDPVPGNNTVTGATTGLVSARLSGGGLGCTMATRDGKAAPSLGVVGLLFLVLMTRQRRRLSYGSQAGIARGAFQKE